ncbi:MAG: AraC family transcriptional regulator [Microbacteriaceae bacterium]
MPADLQLQVDTRDPDDACEQLGRSYCPHRIMQSNSRQHFRAQQHRGGTKDLQVFHLSYGVGTTQIEPVPFDDFVLISRPLSGRFSVRAGNETRTLQPGSTIVLDPYTGYRLRWEDGCALLTIRLDRQDFDRAVGSIRGENLGALTRFPIGALPTRAQTFALDRVTGFLLREVLPGGLLTDAPLMRAEMIRLLTVAVLEAYPRAVTENSNIGEVSPAAIRRAVAFIEQAAEEDIGTAEIAAAARLGPRALQEGFRKHLDRTPLNYLRMIRLHHAHQELLGANGDSAITVASVAFRWGFGNLGRFAAAYRQEFGCAPGQTLRTGR